MTLSVKGVDLILFVVVEALVWEVLLGALQDFLLDFANNALFGGVVDEMIVGEGRVVEKLNKYLVIGYESASDEWVWETLVAHGVIVEPKKLVDI